MGTGGALYLLVLLLNFPMVLTGPRDVYAAQGKPAAQAGAAEPFGQDAFGTHSAAAEVELQKGISLTSQGRFAEAIPHLRAAQGRVREEYAAAFNLALCYVATGQDKPAIRLLTELRESGHNTANLHDLMAQAYAGTGQEVEALRSLEQALALEPNNEKLYVYVEDAATGHQNYKLALKILDLSLQRMPNSARLHYERGVLLSMLDEFDSGKKDFDAADAGWRRSRSAPAEPVPLRRRRGR